MAHELKNVLINRIHDHQLRLYASQYANGRLIDIGCGTKPYRSLLAPYVLEHLGVDHEGSLHDPSNVDLTGSAYDVPAESGSFDTALCTSVLEHVEEPEAALRECFRLLRPGGMAIYSVPFIWHIHEAPRDFYRYSEHGIRYLMEKVGFEVVEIKALSGFWVTFGQLLVYNLFRLHRGPIRKTGICVGIGLLVQGAAYLLDRIDRTEAWTWMYMVAARRPS